MVSDAVIEYVRRVKGHPLPVAGGHAWSEATFLINKAQSQALANLRDAGHELGSNDIHHIESLGLKTALMVCPRVPCSEFTNGILPHTISDLRKELEEHLKNNDLADEATRGIINQYMTMSHLMGVLDERTGTDAR